jgi:hypothetical protein
MLLWHLQHTLCQLCPSVNAAFMPHLTPPLVMLCDGVLCYVTPLMCYATFRLLLTSLLWPVLRLP